MSTEILSARDWLSSQENIRSKTGTGIHLTLLVHNVYESHPDSTDVPSPVGNKDTEILRDGKRIRSSGRLSPATSSFNSRSGFDSDARAVLDSMVLVSSEGNSISDEAGYEALSAAIHGEGKKSKEDRIDESSNHSNDNGGG